MKKYPVILLLLIAAVSAMFTGGCSSRIETPVPEADSTIVFPPKNPAGVSADIILYRKLDKKTGTRIDEGNRFTIHLQRSLHALILLKNRETYSGRLMMFHIDWIDPNGKSLYRKRIDILPGDTMSELHSSILITPQRRQPGRYSIRLYFFRELIAEKIFYLQDEPLIIPLPDEELAANLILYRTVSKKNGKRIGEGTAFTMKKKRSVRALVVLQNRYAFDDRTLKLHLKWIDPDGKTFYRKRITLRPEDTTSVIRSSVSASSEKRVPGNYSLQLRLNNKLIAEKRFILKPAKAKSKRKGKH